MLQGRQPDCIYVFLMHVQIPHQSLLPLLQKCKYHLLLAVAALSSQLSTAALDKHPQSKERGITLDLGFSSFTSDPPPHLKKLKCKKLQITLVDCPGHASLIRTIIGGSQIIDMMMLIVDITKGIQVGCIVNRILAVAIIKDCCCEKRSIRGRHK